MKRDLGMPVDIPGAAMAWAREEANDVRRRNPHLRSFDDLAAILVLRGVIVAATAPELRPTP